VAVLVALAVIGTAQAAKPKAGQWAGTQGVTFRVSPDHKKIGHFASSDADLACGPYDIATINLSAYQGMKVKNGKYNQAFDFGAFTIVVSGKFTSNKHTDGQMKLEGNTEPCTNKTPFTATPD
jgi:hypothetical protein